MLNIFVESLWSRFIFVRLWNTVLLLCTLQWTFMFYKMREISWLAEKLVPFKKHSAQWRHLFIYTQFNLVLHAYWSRPRNFSPKQKNLITTKRLYWFKNLYGLTFHIISLKAKLRKLQIWRRSIIHQILLMKYIGWMKRGLIWEINAAHTFRAKHWLCSTWSNKLLNQ